MVRTVAPHSGRPVGRGLLGSSGISFVDRGLHRLKGVPDNWQLFAVEGI